MIEYDVSYLLGVLGRGEGDGRADKDRTRREPERNSFDLYPDTVTTLLRFSQANAPPSVCFYHHSIDTYINYT